MKILQKANPAQPIRKISRFVVSKVAGPPHSNVIINQQQVTDATRTQLQQTEELKTERQTVPSYQTDDLHGKRILTNNINRMKTN